MKEINMFRKIKKNFKLILYSTFLWGIFAHGMMIFNKFSYHDDAGLFEYGLTYSLGRWMLGLIGDFVTFLFGSGYYSVPLFYGIFTIAFIAGITMLLVDLFEIENKWLIIGLSGVMVAYPAITSTLGYMFVAPYFLFGTMVGVFGVCLACRSRKWYEVAAGLFLTGCSVGIYQAYIPIYVSVILFYAIKKTSEKQNTEWKEFFLLAVKSVGSCIGFMAVYFIGNQIALTITGVKLSDYQGINTMGVTSVRGYLHRVLVAYKEFLIPTDGTSANMYPFSSDVVYKLLLLVIAAASICLLYHCFKKSWMLCLQMCAFMACIPLAVNFIYFMCDPAQVDSIMAYGSVSIFVYLVWILDSGFPAEMAEAVTKINLKHSLVNVCIVLVILLNIMLCRFDNICYLKAEYLQMQTISYFTVLASQIKSTEGFTPNTPVAYVNEYGKYDYTTANIPQFKEIDLVPYGYSNLLNNYAWKITMKMWCNFDPELASASDYEELPEVQEMPAYPSDGSIRMIDGVVVVKF